MKGYKTPTGKPIKKKIMPAGKPIQSDFKAPDLTSRIPEVRPVSMRNLTSWKGFNNGK